MTVPECVLCGIRDVGLFRVVDEKRYWRCRRCEITFMDAADRLSRAREHAHYRLHDNDPTDTRYRAFLSRLTTHLLPRLAQGASGLDYGCGPGPTVSALMQEHGYGVVNYDPLFLRVDAALDKRYDFITCTEVAEHFHDPRREFARLDALLRPGGWLGVMTGMLRRDEDFADWHYRRDPTHVVFYKPPTFAFLAEHFRWRAYHPAPDVVLLEKTARPRPPAGIRA